MQGKIFNMNKQALRKTDGDSLSRKNITHNESGLLGKMFFKRDTVYIVLQRKDYLGKFS